jgi:hypothetical protein
MLNSEITLHICTIEAFCTCLFNVAFHHLVELYYSCIVYSSKNIVIIPPLRFSNCGINFICPQTPNKDYPYFIWWDRERDRLSHLVYRSFATTTIKFFILLLSSYRTWCGVLQTPDWLINFPIHAKKFNFSVCFTGSCFPCVYVCMHGNFLGRPITTREFI